MATGTRLRERGSALSHIAFLSGPRCTGRLPGSPGALAAARYIERGLAGLGLVVQRKEESLTAGYWSQAPRIEASYVSLDYRRDFVEIRAAGSGPGCASGPLTVLTRETRTADLASSSIPLLADPPENLDLTATPRAAKWHGAQALLVGERRGPFLGKGGGAWRSEDGINAIRVTSEAAARLLQAEGELATVLLPYRKAMFQNVVGFEASRPKNGLTALSRLAAWPPNVSLVALFTTGEEIGLQGAHAYVEHPLVPLARTSILNLDTLGADPQRNGIAIGPRRGGGRAGECLAAALHAAGIAVEYKDLPTDRRAFAGRAAKRSTSPRRTVGNRTPPG